VTRIKKRKKRFLHLWHWEHIVSVTGCSYFPSMFP